MSLIEARLRIPLKQLDNGDNGQPREWRLTHMSSPRALLG